MHRKTAAFKRLQPLFVHFQPFQPVLFSTDKFVTKYLLAISATIRLRNQYVTVLPKHCSSNQQLSTVISTKAVGQVGSEGNGSPVGYSAKQKVTRTSHPKGRAEPALRVMIDH